MHSYRCLSVFSFLFLPFFFFFFFFFFLLLVFRATPMVYVSSQARGWVSLCHRQGNVWSELCLLPTTQLTAMPDPRPGIEPASSWIPVGFITTEPQWELLNQFLIWNSKFAHLFHSSWTVIHGSWTMSCLYLFTLWKVAPWNVSV